MQKPRTLSSRQLFIIIEEMRRDWNHVETHHPSKAAYAERLGQKANVRLKEDGMPVLEWPLSYSHINRAVEALGFEWPTRLCRGRRGAVRTIAEQLDEVMGRLGLTPDAEFRHLIESYASKNGHQE